MEVCGGPPGSGGTRSHARTRPFGPADASAPARSSEEHQRVLATQNPARCGVITADSGPIPAGAYSG
eukprot:12932378-Prorocentrum_lima.AAC.1